MHDSINMPSTIKRELLIEPKQLNAFSRSIASIIWLLSTGRVYHPWNQLCDFA